MNALSVSNVAFSNIADRLQELAHTQYYSRQLLYYSYAKEAEAAAVAGRGEQCMLVCAASNAGVPADCMGSLQLAYSG